MVEEWRIIKGFGDNYCISNFGRVKNIKTNKYITGGLDRRGYHKVNLTHEGFIKRFAVHRLVAEYFIDNPNNKEQVNHIDGDKTNNHFSNLEWVTNQENRIHAQNNNLLNDNSREILVGKGKAVAQFDKSGNIIKEWKRITDASKELGIPDGNITNAAQGKRKSAGGYIWRYI